MIPDHGRVQLAQLVGKRKQFLRGLRIAYAGARRPHMMIIPSNFGSLRGLLPSTKYECCNSGSQTSGFSVPRFANARAVTPITVTGFPCEIECLANDGWIAVKLSLPEAIAQNSDWSRAGRVFARWIEQSPRRPMKPPAH